MRRRVQMVPIAACAAVWLIAGGAPVRTQGPGGPPPSAGRPEFRPADRHDTSPALRELPVIPPSEAGRQPLPPRSVVRGPGRNVPAQPDPVLQASGPTAFAPSSIANFDGVNNRNSVLPPDTNGDIGPNHYVQWVNLSFAIYDRAGRVLVGPADGRTIWQGFGGPCATRNDGDPIVLYDHLADRWLMTQFALPNYPNGPFYQCIAISQTGDPTGAYHRYQFSFSKLNDYPKFGLWPDGYYMSINQYTCTLAACTWAGQGVAAFPRAAMLAGGAASMIYFDLASADPNLGGMLPSDLDGPAPPAGAPNYYAQFDDDAWGYSPDQLQIWEFRANWSDPSASTFTKRVELATAAFDSNMCNYARGCIRQGGTSRRLDAMADRLMYRLQYRNFGTHETLVTNHTVDVSGSDHAGVRWYEVRRPSGSTWSIAQQGTFAPDANSRWMGSAAMDARGNIAIGYNVSSSTLFPRIGFTGRRPSDAAGQMTMGEGDMQVGTGGQTSTSSRWGDYSLLAVDPADGCTFWFTTEYLATTSTAGWRTRIGSFQVDCGTPDPVPPNPPSNLNAAAISSVSIALTWTDNSSDETGFVVERCLGAACSNFAPLPASIGPGATSYTDSGLSASTAYTYRVKAVNASLSSAYSNSATTTTMTDTTPPPAGTMTVGSLSGTGVKLSGPNWQARVTVTVVDSNNQPVNGATVTGTWSNGGTGTCSTGAGNTGTCTVTLDLHNRNGSVTFSVSSVTHATLTYSAGSTTQVSVIKP